MLNIPELVPPRNQFPQFRNHLQIDSLRFRNPFQRFPEFLAIPCNSVQFPFDLIPGIPFRNRIQRREETNNNITSITEFRNRSEFREFREFLGIPCNSGITTSITIVSCYIHLVMNRFRSGIPESVRIPGIPSDSV